LQFFKDVNKRTGRLACNIPLLRAGLAPLSFMEMDKAKYVRGLVAVYELGRTDLIGEAFVEGYMASASRYDAYAGRDRRSVELEFKRRADIYGLVKTYVADSVASDEIHSAQEYALDALAREHPEDDPETRRAVVDRIVEIVEALHDGNHAAYGIPRELFDAYAALQAAANPSP
ncbi:MAG: hypothetical protein ACREB5_11060, partial [Sphingomonadaceae bacterium]